MVTPVYENDASAETQRLYTQIKNAVGLTSLPLFFAYLGAFPDYLNYITNQIVRNLNSAQFLTLCGETKSKIKNQLDIYAPKTDEIDQWLRRYKNSPAFYNFQNDLTHIFLTNIKLVFIFLSLREALKGWAVAAKKLPSTSKQTGSTVNASIENEDLVFEGFDTTSGPVPKQNLTNTDQSATLSVRGDFAMERDLLPNYLKLCRNEFTFILKTNEFWQMRVRVEELFLHDLAVLPDLIFSPINIVLKLTEKYRDFPDLLYLLSEHFPTYAMQRMLFSGFMLN